MRTHRTSRATDLRSNPEHKRSGEMCARCLGHGTVWEDITNTEVACETCGGEGRHFIAHEELP